MPFVPAFKIIEVPKSSAYLRLSDVTPTYTAPLTNPTGYGAPGAPVNASGVTDVRVAIKYLPEPSIAITQGLVERNTDGTVKINYFLRDGVHTITWMSGMVCPIAEYGWTLVAGSGGTKLQCTLTGTLTYADALGNISHIRSGDVADAPLIAVKSIDLTAGIIELATPLLLAPIYLVKYYSASINLLILNGGEGALIKDISTMAITSTECDYTKSADLMNRVLLKLAAQTAFNCGNCVKAHNAAQLLNDTYFPDAQPCATCQ